MLQHLPDPELVLGYVRDMGRILRPGGWAAFQVSTDPAVHRRRPLPRRLATNALGALRRRPGGQAHPAWLGCAVPVDDVRAAAADGGMEVERVEGEGTQICLVLTRRVPVSRAAGDEARGG